VPEDEHSFTSDQKEPRRGEAPRPKFDLMWRKPAIQSYGIYFRRFRREPFSGTADSYALGYCNAQFSSGAAGRLYYAWAALCFPAGGGEERKNSPIVRAKTVRQAMTW
jgi:hypothetical protein